MTAPPGRSYSGTMLALALLLAVDPPPATVRVEVTDRMIIEGEDDPPIWTTEALETAVAADGTFSARVSDGGRTRTFSGKVGRERGHWTIRLKYKDLTGIDWVPAVGGGWEPVESLTATSTYITVQSVGSSVEFGLFATSSSTAGGPVKNVSRTLAVTLRPRAVEAPPPVPWILNQSATAVPAP